MAFEGKLDFNQLLDTFRTYRSTTWVTGFITLILIVWLGFGYRSVNEFLTDWINASLLDPIWLIGIALLVLTLGMSITLVRDAIDWCIWVTSRKNLTADQKEFLKQHIGEGRRFVSGLLFDAVIWSLIKEGLVRQMRETMIQRGMFKQGAIEITKRTYKYYRKHPEHLE